MIKLVVLVALGVIAYKLVTGLWPWQSSWWHSILRQPGAGPQRLATRERARVLLGVPSGAGRQDILEAHRRLIATVHPDRGGSNELVHEANAARDVLLADLPQHAQE